MKENPLSRINQWVTTQSSSFLKAGLPRPEFYVLEVSRALGVSCEAIIRSVIDVDEKNIGVSAWASPKRVDKRVNEIRKRRKLASRRPWDPARTLGKLRKNQSTLREQVSKELGAKRVKIKLGTNSAAREIVQTRDFGVRYPETLSEAFTRVINRLSLFPGQNLAPLSAKAERPNPFIKFGCFICLTMTCNPNQNRPEYSIVNGSTRIEAPKITRRTREILSALKQSGTPFEWDFLISDTDPEEIYGEWLVDPKIGTKIDGFTSAIENKLRLPPGEVKFIRWSNIQSSYSSYLENFNRVFRESDTLVGKDYVSKSASRRLEYFRQKGFIETPEIRRICDVCARRNIALYVAQGPILETEYDCLVIADPDPLRLGKIQSLLAPNLPIWYPYPG